MGPSSDPSQVTLWRSLSVPINHQPAVLYLTSTDLRKANGLFLKIMKDNLKKKNNVLSVV